MYAMVWRLTLKVFRLVLSAVKMLNMIYTKAVVRRMIMMCVMLDVVLALMQVAIVIAIQVVKYLSPATLPSADRVDHVLAAGIQNDQFVVV